MARGRVTITFAGAPAFVAKLAKASEQGLRASEAGLFAAGNVIMEEAKHRSPVDTGTLAGSGYVTLPERVGDTVAVEIGFGGPAEAYAVVQHEDLSYRHPVGQAKFLETAMDDRAAEARDTMARVAAASLSAPVGLTSVYPTTPGGA